MHMQIRTATTQPSNRKSKWARSLMLVASAIMNASAATYFNADFEASTQAFANALTEGTSQGSWRLNIEGTVSYASNGWVRLDTDSDGYDYIAEVDSTADYSNNTVTLSYDVRNIRSAANQGGKASKMMVLDSGADKLIDLRLSTSSGITYLDYNTSGGFTNLSTSLLDAYGNTNVEPPEDWDSIEVVMDAFGVDVFLNGIQIGTDLSYYSALDENINELNLKGLGTAQSGAWYDNLLLTTDDGTITTNFFCDFEDVPYNQDLVDYLNAGTSEGSWAVSNQQESAIVENADNNILVTFDKGTYDFYATPVSNAPLSNIDFSLDFRMRRAGATKPSVVVFYNENDNAFAAIRFRDNWNGNGLSELQVATNAANIEVNGLEAPWVTISTNLLGVSSETIPTNSAMQSLTISLDASGCDIALEDVSVTSSIPYFVASSEISQIQFLSPSGNGGMWYDNIRLANAGISSIGLIDLVPLDSGDLEVSWDAEAVGTYVLQSRIALNSGSWSNAVPGITGTDGTLAVTTTPTAVQSFYRVIGE